MVRQSGEVKKKRTKGFCLSSCHVFFICSINMNTRFAPNTDKLNLKFEGYKLRSFQEATSLVRFPLADIQVYEPTSDQRLGFRDLQARIRHSNLIYGHPLDQHRGSSFCIDQEFNLYMIVCDKVEAHVATSISYRKTLTAMSFVS